MYEYEYTTVEAEGLMGVKFLEHRELIDRRAKDGWRYVGYVPTKIVGYGALVKIDLVFEREI